MATLAGCDKADKVSDTTKKPVIKIGSDNYPPYNFLNEDGIPTGIDVELATDCLLYTSIFIQSPVERLISSPSIMALPLPERIP